MHNIVEFIQNHPNPNIFILKILIFTAFVLYIMRLTRRGLHDTLHFVPRQNLLQIIVGRFM